MSRRLLSIMLFITILVGLLPAVAQGELYVDRYEIQYATGEVDGEGDPLYELAIPGVDILTPVLLDDGRLWIQTLNGFWQDPVRVFAMVVKDGVTEMIPFTDAFGSEWLSLSDGGAFATAFRLTVDGMPYMESGIVLSSQPPESVPLSWDDTPPENPAPENVSLYAPNEPPAADNGWGYVDNTPNNPEPEPQNWYEPPANAENNVLVRQNSLLMNESAFAIPNNASAVIEAQLPDPPEYENPFGRSTAETVLYHPDHPTMPIGNMPEDTKFIVNEAPGGGLLYARDGEGKVLISVTSLDGLWNGYILADAAEFWSKADEDSYRRFLWESSLQTPPENRTSDYGRITVANAMLYAGVTGAGVTTLPSGTTMVYSGSYDYDADGNLWLAVRSHDASLSGYIPYSAFAFYDAQGERNYLESLKEKLPADSKNAYGRITAANAELFSNIGVSTGTFLPFGNVVMLNGSEKHDANGKLYVPVKSEDGTRTGYIKMSDFRFMNDAERIAYDASKQPAPPQPQPMPDRQTDYAYIKSVGATLYDRSGRQIGVFAGNTAVEYLKNAQDPTYVNDSTGKRYLLVKADVNGGAQGYVQADSLDFMTTREKSSYDKEKEAANKPAVTEDALQPGVSRYGYVLSNNINVLKLPGSGGDLVTRVNTDEVVLVTEEVIGTNSTPYYHIMLEDKAGKPQGYILKTYVRLMTSQEQARYIASLSSGSKTNPPTPVTQVSGYYRVSASYALMMPFEDIGASPIAALKAGDVVYVYKQVYDKSNNLFHYAYISATNQWGYILASSLMPMSPQEVGNYFKTTPPTAAPAQTYSPSAYSGYAILTSNSINFRSGASVNSKALTQLKQNTIVRVLEQLQSEGATWYKCESGGITGYIRGDLLSLLTISQYMSYMTTPSYNQGGNIITPTATVKPANITSNTWATPRPNQTITFVTIPPLFAVSPAPTLDPFATPTP
ncbi:MAG: SH3 domain-containing protein, partial [Firmicutes bacterium]|nr:SH3 domain-containing protein [Bacillota bacterium]